MLDLCCGDGFNSFYFYSLRAASVTAIDFDREAIRWAIKQRKRSSTPIVWITDGQVHGLGTGGQYGGYHDILAQDCIKEVLKHKVFMAHDVKQGLAVLKQLSVGKKPTRWYPRCWQETYLKLNGKRLG